MTAEQKKQFLSFIEEGAEIDAEVYFICKLDEDAVGNKETVTLDISATKTVNITVGDNKPAPADTPPEIVSKDGVYYDGIIT